MAKHFAPGAQVPEDDEPQMARPTVSGAPTDSAGAGVGDASSAKDSTAAAGDSAEWPSLDEMPRKRRRRRRKGRRALKILGIVVAVVGLIAGGAAWTIQSSIERGRQAFQDSMQKTMEQNANTVQYNGKSYALNEHMVTVAFIGFDNRTTNETTGEATEGQSDTIIVLALNTDTGAADAIVVPRDSMVPVDMYVDGSYTGQSTMQICLQYS